MFAATINNFIQRFLHSSARRKCPHRCEANRTICDFLHIFSAIYLAFLGQNCQFSSSMSCHVRFCGDLVCRHICGQSLDSNGRFYPHSQIATLQAGPKLIEITVVFVVRQFNKRFLLRWFRFIRKQKMQQLYLHARDFYGFFLRK